ncbi:hypothetical protein EDD58_103411 [Hazenella coriacea]|uniref:Uncharacterized protein n=1 Tax=Hazenella coriacea TaxID=1179467 RepID=A0A4R3LBU2_9BACL|nr:hypothetical protein EDD58_103411 [Hazenella coriacea]
MSKIDQVVELLKFQIQEEKYVAGEKLSSEQELAKS